MSKETKIQWCDSTENPVMGCEGCPLYPSSTSLVAIEIARQLTVVGTTEENATKLLKQQFGDLLFSELYQQRMQIGKVVAAALRIQGIRETSAAARLVTQGIASHLRCYAGVLHTRYGSGGGESNKVRNPGYAPRFEEPKLFQGRMAKAAKMRDLVGRDREDKPWLNGLPRLIFVSDMGDALSKDVSFGYLKQEIIDVAISDNGSRHVWLWLTKRPRRMADFSDWLIEQGIQWPDNLVPMTSVLDQSMAVQVKYLKRIPAKVRGLSVEPLWEQVEIDLDGIDWVIVGGESGPNAKPFQLSWARSLRDRCETEGKSFFMKQLGKRPHDGDLALKLSDEHGGDWTEWPEDLRLRQVPQRFRALFQTGEANSVTEAVTFATTDTGDLGLFIELNKIVIRGFEAFLEAGEALAEIRDRELWRSANFANWGAYCASIVGLSKVHANRLIRAAQVWRSINDEVEPVGSGNGVVVPRSESQLRPLGKLADPVLQRRAWTQAVTKAGAQPTAKAVQEAVVEIEGLRSVVRKEPKSKNRNLRLVIAEAIELSRDYAAHVEIESRLKDALALAEKSPDGRLARAS